VNPRAFAVALALGVSTAIGATVAGQEPPVQEVVRSIQESGSISSTLQHVIIRGCPQGDAYDRAIIDAVSEASIPSGAVEELALLWRDPFAKCAYGPLDTWVERNLLDLSQSADLSAFFMFVRSIAPVLTDGLRDVIWTAIETRPLSSDLALSLATTAVAGDDPSGRISRTLEAFQNRQMPPGWIEIQSGVLVRDEPTAFLQALTAASPSLTDERLRSALDGINQMLRSGQLDPEQGELGGLRARVETREGIPISLRELRGNER